MTDVRMGIYRHFKGPLYQVLGLAHDANDEKRICVVYFPLQLDSAHLGPRMAVRTLEQFTGQVHSYDGMTTWQTCVWPSLCSLGPDYHQKRFRYLGPELTRAMLP